MSISEQVDALYKRLADLKSSAYQARQETDERIKAGIDQAKAEIAVRQNAHRGHRRDRRRGSREIGGHGARELCAEPGRPIAPSPQNSRAGAGAAPPAG